VGRLEFFCACVWGERASTPVPTLFLLFPAKLICTNSHRFASE